MEKRMGGIIILVENKDIVEELNKIITLHGNLIIARQGIPINGKGISVISLVIEGSTDEVGSLTGKLGRLKGVQVKSVLVKNS
ncbi:MAG: hypothetical protein N4A72_11830 [Bacteroidales bacterium]|jgi:putative iron-only hydrogenase system regulator|nr:hypothetical protein [Bacteroidales bacterium]